MMIHVELILKLKTIKLKKILCNCSDTFILSKAVPKNNKQVIFKKCTPFPDCISEVNNTQVCNAKCLDVMMSKYN